MEELANLQKKFLEIQKSGGGFKLSERTVVDIINKVLNRGKIKINFTTNGREYVTDEKITKEIHDEILKNKGRISKVNLQKLLDVQNNILETRLNLLFSKDKNLNVIENNIITNYYLENMAREINYNLKSSGSLLISDISNTYDLSINFFKKFLQEKTGENKIIEGKLYPNRILTDDYTQSQLKKIRPILIGSIMPISLAHMINNYQIDEFIINDLIERLISQGVVRGKISSNIFEPAIFEESKISYIKGSLSQNNYLDYNLIKNIGIKNPREFLGNLMKTESTLKNLIFLKDFVISENLKNNFEYSFFENFSKNYCTNLNNIFLFELSDEDIYTLLDKINVKNNSVILINLNIIPVNFVEEFIFESNPMLKEEASRQYNNFVNKNKEKEKKKQEKENESNNKKSKNKTKGKSKKNESEEEEDELPEKSNNIILNKNILNEISTKLKKSQNLEDSFNLESTVENLFENNIKGQLNKSYSQFVNEFIQTKTKPTNDPKNLSNQIETEYLELKYIQKSLDLLSNLSSETLYQSALKAILAHLCKKDLQNLFKNILMYQLIHMKSKIDLNKINLPNERKEIITSLMDDELRFIFNKLNELIQNKNFVEFLDYLQKNSKDLAISITPFDKKKEKVLSEKFNLEYSKLLKEKESLLEKGFKKDYIGFLIDFGLNKLFSKGYFLKLPCETWVVTIFLNLFAEKSLELLEVKDILGNINSYLNLSDDEFYLKNNEVYEFTKKLLE